MLSYRYMCHYFIFQVTVPDSPDFVNEFSIISTTRSFTLTARLVLHVVNPFTPKHQYAYSPNTSPKVLTKRICLTIKSFLSW